MNLTQRISFLLAGCLTLMTIVLMVIWTHAEYRYAEIANKLVRGQAIAIGQTTAAQVAATRAVYAKEIVEKLTPTGTVFSATPQNTNELPLPATLIGHIANRMNTPDKSNPDFVVLSKWNINPQKGLTTEFERAAWDFLQRQEQELKSVEGYLREQAYQPYTDRVDVDGEPFMFVMTPDLANEQSCVSCHNKLEQREDILARRGNRIPKSFELFQLMGMVLTKVPIKDVLSATNLISKQQRETRDESIIAALICIVTMLITMGFVIHKYLVVPIEMIRTAMRNMRENARQDNVSTDHVSTLHSPTDWIQANPISETAHAFSEVRLIGEDLYSTVNEIRKTHKNLHRSEEYLHATFNSIVEAMLGTDATGRITRMNQEAERLTGWTFSDAFNQPLNDVLKFINTRTRLHVESMPENVAATSPVPDEWGDTTLISREGTEYQIVKSAASIHSENGNLLGVVYIFRDVTVEHSRREELIRLREYLSNIIEYMPSSLIGVDACGVVTQWNNEAERSTGVSSKQAVGLPLERSSPHLSEKMVHVHRAMHDRQIINRPNEIRKRNGKTLFESMTIYPLGTELSATKGAVIRIDDVTEERQLQEQLHYSQKMDAIGQLAGGVAHDFNNMLGGIIGAAEILQVSIPENDKNHEFVGVILEAAERLTDLATKLLAFSQRQALGSAPTDIHYMIDQTVSLLRGSIDKRITIETDLAAQASIVTGDSAQLQSVFLNLGINASHAMPEGGILSIQTDVVDLSSVYCDDSEFSLKPGQYVTIDMRDTGTGISPEVLPHIWEPFYTTKEEGNGTGLGLAAAYGCVKQHHGALTVNTAVGSGTTFHVLLPLINETSSLQSFPEEMVQGTGLILLVDDEKLIRITCKLQLERFGYEVILANDGKDAVEIFTQRAADIGLVILDVMMPVMDGRECFKQMNSICPEVPVILSSGFSDTDTLDELKKLGLVGFICKPYRSYELSHVVAASLRKIGE